MITAAQIKLLKSLKKKKNKIKENKFLIEGEKIILEAIHNNIEIDEILISSKYENSNNSIDVLLKSSEKNIHINKVSNDIINKITELEKSPGIIAIANIPLNLRPKKKITIHNNVIILDQISDPGNLGTIIRTAVWFNIKNIILSKNTVSPLNPKVIRSSMGSNFYLNIHIAENLNDLIHQLIDKKFFIVGTSVDNQTNFNKKSFNKKRWALVFGNESGGINKSTKSKIKNYYSIPQTGQIESLNVAIACGITLFDLTIINNE